MPHTTLVPASRMVSLYEATLALMVISSPLVFIMLQYVTAPYGRHGSTGWGPSLNARLGWFVMESPASLVFAAFFFYNSPVAFWQLPPAVLILFALWQFHYVHRAFIFPFQIQTSNRMPAVVCLSAFTFCTVNGYLQAAYLSDLAYASHVYADGYHMDARFIVGVALYAFGYWLNKDSDRILRELRTTSPAKNEVVAAGHYRIPHGGAFSLVSAPNYFGELIEWTGYALAAWSPAGVAFVLFSLANLVPRAVSNHAWYKKTFGAAYPKQRRAVIPYLL